jgi:homoserine O-succinyltransferase
LAREKGLRLAEFPENQVLEHIDNTWGDTAKAVFNNWLGKVYQLTHQQRNLPFMAGVDPDNPLDL